LLWYFVWFLLISLFYDLFSDYFICTIVFLFNSFLLTLVTFTAACFSQMLIIDFHLKFLHWRLVSCHLSPSSSVLCCRLQSILLQLYLKPAAYISFSRCFYHSCFVALQCPSQFHFLLSWSSAASWSVFLHNFLFVPNSVLLTSLLLLCGICLCHHLSVHIHHQKLLNFDSDRRLLWCR